MQEANTFEREVVNECVGLTAKQLTALCVVMVGMKLGFVAAQDVTAAAHAGIGAEQFVEQRMDVEHYIECIRHLNRRTA